MSEIKKEISIRILTQFLNGNRKVAEDLDKTLRLNVPKDWKGDKSKEKFVRNIISAFLQDDQATSKIFNFVNLGSDYPLED